MTVATTPFADLKDEPNTAWDVPRPKPTAPAHVITSDEEAVDVAQKLAAEFAPGAAARDRNRRLPLEEVDQFSQSGLWGISVPKEYGGADVSNATIAEVFATISAADGSIGQIAQNHFCDVNTMRWAASDAQKRFFYGEILRGVRLGNALAEPSHKIPGQYETRLHTREDGELVLSGRKIYSTGSLLSHWVQVGATTDDNMDVLVLVPRDHPGLEVIDDWSGMGQRTTASGSVVISDIVVPREHVIPAHKAFSEPSTNGPHFQILHAAIDLGIARAAVNDTIAFITLSARNAGKSAEERVTGDPFTISQVGDLEYRLHSAEALMERAGLTLDEAAIDTTDETVALATVAVFEAKIASTELSILATNKLFELAGTRSTLRKYNLDRHWRNARTHTLHDPIRWKYHDIGNYYVNGVFRRHAWH